MYKISVFFVLLIMGCIFKKVDTITQAQAVSAPVAVQVQPQTSHNAGKKHGLTPEKFKERVGVQVARLKASKAKWMNLSGNVEASEKSWFDLHMMCANAWIKALESYQSTDTKTYRSAGFASKELNAAAYLTRLKPTQHHSTKAAAYPEADVVRLEARFNAVRVHANALDGDNRKAFDAMIFCAGEYLKVLKAAKGQPMSVRRLLRRAMDYVNTAEAFVHSRASPLVKK